MSLKKGERKEGVHKKKKKKKKKTHQTHAGKHSTIQLQVHSFRRPWEN